MPICGWDLFDVSIEFSRKLHSPSYLFAINRRFPDNPPNDPFDSIVACGCFTIDDRDTSFSFHSIHHPAGMSCKGLTVAFFLLNRKKKKHSTFTCCCCWWQMESLVREMQDPENGVPVRSQKLFLTSIPSAFMGQFARLIHFDMILWSHLSCCFDCNVNFYQVTTWSSGWWNV